MSGARNKVLKLAYKLNPPVMGVYAIRNVATGRTLLGASRNLPGIINRHRFQLKMGSHRLAALQADWRRHGEAGFVFEIVDEVALRADPDVDYDEEIALLLLMWQEQFPPGTSSSYL